MIGKKYFLKQARDEKYEETTFSVEEDAPPEAETALKELLAASQRALPFVDERAFDMTTGRFIRSDFENALAECRAAGLMEE